MWGAPLGLRKRITLLLCVSFYFPEKVIG
jgi:hypothetical protein